MKRIYMLFGFLAVASMTFGQVAQKKAEVSKQIVESRYANVHNATTQQDVNREVLWSNTFADPSEWQFGNDGSFSAIDESIMDLNWQIGVDLEPSGDAAREAVESTTYADGTALVDSDLFANQDGVAVENCWFQNIAPIDCSSASNVRMSFECYYFKWDSGQNDGNEHCLVEISNDGVTWPDVATEDAVDADPGTRFEIFPDMGTQDFTPNPMTVDLDISQMAAGQDSVYVRFRWVGVWGYSWQIDDLKICDSGEYDLNLNASILDYQDTYSVVPAPAEIGGNAVYDNVQWTMYPESQRPDLFGYSIIRNYGSQQDSVHLVGEFNGEVLQSDSIDFPANSVDTLDVGNFATDGLANGMYDFNLSVYTDEEDATPEDNSGTTTIEMTDFLYARDNGALLSGYPNIFANGDFSATQFVVGNTFRIFEDATAYGLEVVFVDGAEFGQSTDTDQEVQASIWDLGNSNIFSDNENDPEDLLDGDYYDYVVGANDLNTFDDAELTWTKIRFEDEIELEAGQLILAGINRYEGGGSVFVGEDETAPSGDAFLFNDGWFLADRVLLIRLSFDPETGLEEYTNDTTIGLGQNVPNPAAGTTKISYSIAKADQVSFQVTDALGRVVYTENRGYQAPGVYAVDLNVSDFEAGTYTYTLTSGEERVTKKMIIE